MSFDSYQAVTIDRMGSLVTGYDRRNLTHGVAPVVRNCRFGLNFVATRYGLDQAIVLPEQASITGLDLLIRVAANPAYIPLIFTDSGTLYQEFPVGSGIVARLQPSSGALPSAAFMEMVAVYQRAYMLFTDLLQGLGSPLVFDGANLDPWTQRPIGEAWAKATTYQQNEIVCPTAANNHIYQCVTPGISGNVEPVWPLTVAGTVNDGTCVWKEANPVFANQLPIPAGQPIAVRVPGGGGIAAGRDVYILTTYTNGVGETTPSLPVGIASTVLNDAIVVTSPAIPVGFNGLQAPYAITGYNVYEADVAHGGAFPTVFKLVNVAGPVPIGTPVNILATPATGAVSPAVNTANISPVGNVCSGPRYGLVFFVNRQGNICGVTRASAQLINLATQGFQLFGGNIPVGPSNVTQRIVAFTVAGATQSQVSVSGPYTYIAQPDNSGGVTTFGCVINDNVSTSAYFNFTDQYLKDATDVTDYLRAIKLPPQAKAFYVGKKDRIAVIGEAGQPSLIRFSEAGLPATFYGDTGYLYVYRDDGQRMMAVGEYKQEIYAVKERSGYVLNTDTGDPLSWGPQPRWKDSGPAGMDAIAFGSEFIVWGNESGAWLYQGQDKECISDEIRETWKQINWAAGGGAVQVTIDEIEREVRFAVPMGGTTQPNKVLTVSYLQGWGQPIQFSSFSGKLVTHPNSRKWSIDDISSNRLTSRVYRPLGNDFTTNPILAKTQVLVGSNQEDGMVYMIRPDYYADNGMGIDSYYEFAPLGVVDVPLYQAKGITGGLARLGGFVVSMEGNGHIIASRVGYDNKSTAWERDIHLSVSPSFYYRRYGNFLSRKWGIGFSNNAEPGAWFKIFDIDVYLKQYKVQENAIADVRG